MTLESSGSRGAIEASKTSFSPQYHPWITRQAQSLQATQNAAQTSEDTTKRIEALEQLVNQLSKQLAAHSAAPHSSQ